MALKTAHSPSLQPVMPLRWQSFEVRNRRFVARPGHSSSGPDHSCIGMHDSWSRKTPIQYGHPLEDTNRRFPTRTEHSWLRMQESNLRTVQSRRAPVAFGRVNPDLQPAFPSAMFSGRPNSNRPDWSTGCAVLVGANAPIVSQSTNLHQGAHHA
jgi:hypothetical protein